MVREVFPNAGIGEELIYKWKNLHTGGTAASSVESGSAAQSNISAGDYERLKAKLREAEQERDFKKSVGHF